MRHAVIALSFLLVAKTASAQGYYPPYPPPPPPPAPPAVQPLEQAGTVQTAKSFGVGVRTASMTVASSTNPNQKVALVGVGVQARYRFSPTWSLELALESLNNDNADNFNVFQRRTSSGVIAVRYHFSPASEWDLYALLGFGGTEDEVTLVDTNGTAQTQKFAESQVRFGGGIEYRLGAALGLGGDDQAGDGPLYMGIDNGPVPAKSSGGEVNLTLTLYL